MIPGTFNTTLIVPININAFSIDNNIENYGNACKSKQKDHNLAIEQQNTIEKCTRGTIALKTFFLLFTVNSIFKPIRSIHL